MSLKTVSGQSSHKDAEPGAVEEGSHLGVVPRDLVEAVEARVAVDRGVGMDVVRASLVVALEVRLHAAVDTKVILLEVCAAREESGEAQSRRRGSESLLPALTPGGAVVVVVAPAVRSICTAAPLSRLWHFEQQSSADTDSWQR